jgi:hypothetical protein
MAGSSGFRLHPSAGKIAGSYKHGRILMGSTSGVEHPPRHPCERYSKFGAADRPTPSWSMTKAITCTMIGRLIQEGWLA